MTNSPETTSNHLSPLLSSLGESGFLSHRPRSASIDSITQGFRFAAPGKKPLIATSVGGEAIVQDVNSAIASRERIGGGFKMGDASNSSVMEALKVTVPILPSASAFDSPDPQLSPIVAATTLAIRDGRTIFPPAPAQRPSNRGQNTRMTTEKRKRIDNSSSLVSGGEDLTRSNHGTLLAQATRSNGERGHFEAPEARGSRAPRDERGPKRTRQDKPASSSRSHNAPIFSTPIEGNRGLEIIVLDDDVKAEPTEVNTSMVLQCENMPNGNHEIEMSVQVQNSESLQQRDTFQVHTDQLKRRHALQSKDSNRRIETRPDMFTEITGTSNPRSGAGTGTGGRISGSNRPGVSSDNIMRRKRPENDDHVTEAKRQRFNPRAAIASSITPAFQEEQEQNSTGEHRLLVALTTLTTEKQALEKKLRETIVSLEAHIFRAETSERKNSELEAQVQTFKDIVTSLKKKTMSFQKFVDGLGKDYNMLNQKNLQINNRLDEVSRDRDELLKNLQDVKCLTEKVDGTVQGWGSSRAMLKDTNKEIEKLNKTLKFLHSQLSDNAGLLAAERDRTQSLESQIKDDREKNKTILAAIQDGKLELVEKLVELQNTFGTNTDLKLEEKLTGLQKTMAINIEMDGETTRNSVSRCLKLIEKLRDREVDAAECLIGVEKSISDTAESIVGLFHETHKMNIDALSFTDGYISHLVSRIKDLEAESREMYEKYEISLVVSAEKGQLEKELQQQLKATIENYNEMSNQVEKGKMVENCLNESISTLQHKLSILETRPLEDLTLVETIKNLKHKNCELQKECELAKNGVRDASSSLQKKDSELESLKTELQSLVTEFKQSKERIEGFENEKADFMARAEEQKMKERIDVETNANMFRQRETSRLNNQIKALEAQKERLETENKRFRIAEAKAEDRTLDLRQEFTQLQKQYAIVENAHLQLIHENTRLENLVNHTTQLELAARSGCSVLEERTETTAEELSKALGQVSALLEDKNLMLQDIHNKQQELEVTKSENNELRTVAEDATALRIVERQLRKDLEEAELEKLIARREKEKAFHAYQVLGEKTRLLEESFEGLKGASEGLEDGSSSTITNLNKELDSLRTDNEKLAKTKEKIVTEIEIISNSTSPGKREIETPTGDHGTDQKRKEKLTMLSETSETFWDDDSQPLSPFTPQECILETQMEGCEMDNTVEPENEMWSNFSRIDNAKFERYLFGENDMVDVEELAEDIFRSPSKSEGQIEGQVPNVAPTNSWIKELKKTSQNSQPRKNMATHFSSRRRTPSIAFDGICGDQATAIEDFSDDSEDKAARVGVSLPRNTHLEQTNPILLTPRPRTVEAKDNRNRKRVGISESTPIERNSFTPTALLNKPKTPQRNDSRGLADDGRKPLHRPRKDRGKKIRDDQEWVEEEGELVRNNKGKEETPSVKRGLRSYKEKKKAGGKRFM